MSNEIRYGEKYEKGLDVKTIAARIRADIKAAKLPGKMRVTISRYSGGQSIRILATLPFVVRHNDAQQDEMNRARGVRCPGFTSEAHEVWDKLQAIGRAYNFDGSDIMTDYYHVNFHLSVDLEEAAS